MPKNNSAIALELIAASNLESVILIDFCDILQ